MIETIGNDWTVRILNLIGDVQMKGFRRWILKPARELGLEGFIFNDQYRSDLVRLVVSGPSRDVFTFIEVTEALIFDSGVEIKVKGDKLRRGDLPQPMARISNSIEDEEDRFDRALDLLESMNDTLLDMNQSIKRIDNTTQESNTILKRIDNTTQNIDKTTQRIDKTTQNIDKTTQRIDKTTQNIDKTTQRIDKTTQRIDKTTQNIDQTTQRIDATTQRSEKILNDVNATTNRSETILKKIDHNTKISD